MPISSGNKPYIFIHLFKFLLIFNAKKIKILSKINISVSHQLNHDEALSRIKKFCDVAPKRFADEAKDLKFIWNGSANNFSFKVGSSKINGTLAVNLNNVVVVCNIPFVFLFFKGQIDKVVREYAAQILKK